MSLDGLLRIGVRRKLDSRIKPELRLTIRMRDMDVNALLLAGVFVPLPNAQTSSTTLPTGVVRSALSPFSAPRSELHATQLGVRQVGLSENERPMRRHPRHDSVSARPGNRVTWTGDVTSSENPRHRGLLHGVCAKNGAEWALLRLTTQLLSNVAIQVEARTQIKRVDLCAATVGEIQASERVALSAQGQH